jgi:hypothetical protein
VAVGGTAVAVGCTAATAVGGGTVGCGTDVGGNAAVAVGAGIAVGCAAAVAVGDGTGVAVGAAVAVGCGAAVAVGGGVAVGSAVAVDVGCGAAVGRGVSGAAGPAEPEAGVVPSSLTAEESSHPVRANTAKEKAAITSVEVSFRSRKLPIS